MTDLRLNHPAQADDGAEHQHLALPQQSAFQLVDRRAENLVLVRLARFRTWRHREVRHLRIDDKVARDVTGRLLALAADAAPIDVYVNSPGGHVESGDTMLDRSGIWRMLAGPAAPGEPAIRL